MTNSTLIHNVVLYGAQGIDDGTLGWVLVEGRHIAAVGLGQDSHVVADTIVDGDRAMLMPGLIDTHVHFREPGLVHKATIASESAAAIRGGVTSYIEMPNTIPATTTASEMMHKLEIAATDSIANYGFMLGATDGILEALKTLENDDSLDRLPAVKLFLGTTTGGMAMPSESILKQMLAECARMDIPVVVHAEDNEIIAHNTKAAIERYGSEAEVPLGEHNNIRSAEACVSSTRRAINMAKESGIRLHIAHVSTVEETTFLEQDEDLSAKRITAETTPMYLDPVLCKAENRSWRHKINPAIKADALQLQQAVRHGLIDTIATDHAPHLATEKRGGALTAASGAPSVEFALPMLLEYFDPALIAHKMAYNPARLFKIEGRGAIAPGYFADLTLVSQVDATIIYDDSVHSPCGWTPFKDRTVHHKVTKVWLNGVMVLDGDELSGKRYADPLIFNHNRRIG